MRLLLCPWSAQDLELQQVGYCDPPELMILVPIFEIWLHLQRIGGATTIGRQLSTPAVLAKSLDFSAARISASCCCYGGRHTHVESRAAFWDSSGSENVSRRRCCFSESPRFRRDCCVHQFEGCALTKAQCPLVASEVLQVSSCSSGAKTLPAHESRWQIHLCETCGSHKSSVLATSCHAPLFCRAVSGCLRWVPSCSLESWCCS